MKTTSATIPKPYEIHIIVYAAKYLSFRGVIPLCTSLLYWFVTAVGKKDSKSSEIRCWRTLI